MCWKDGEKELRLPAIFTICGATEMMKLKRDTRLVI